MPSRHRQLTMIDRAGYDVQSIPLCNVSSGSCHKIWENILKTAIGRIKKRSINKNCLVIRMH